MNPQRVNESITKLYLSNKHGIICFIAGIFLMSLSCSYTQLKTTPGKRITYSSRNYDQTKIEYDTIPGLNSKFHLLCTTRRGVLIDRRNGRIIYRDSSFTFTLKRDSTWIFINADSAVQGKWKIEDGDPKFTIVLKSKEYSLFFNQWYSCYFRKNHLYMKSLFGPHIFECEWQLT
jgi:hypothetical protein